MNGMDIKEALSWAALVFGILDGFVKIFSWGYQLRIVDKIVV